MLGGAHVRLHQQDEMPNACLRGALDRGPEQCSARSQALLPGRHGQGPDLGLVPADDHLAGIRPALQHDGPEYPVVALAGDGHQDRAAARGAESAQDRRVPGIRRQVTARLVGGHPELTDLG
jgi:hypothetical protein